MLTDDILKDYSLNIEQEQDMMAKFFYSSVKAVYLEILSKNKVRADITVGTIEDYITKNPFDDVLDQTKDLFQRMPIISQRDLLEGRQFISPEITSDIMDDFTSTMENIRRIYYSAFPTETLQKHGEQINLFFDRIRRFGCSEIING